MVRQNICPHPSNQPTYRTGLLTKPSSLPPRNRHLGMKKELSPHARGFDKSFVYLAGAGNHYNNEPQLDSYAGFKQPAVWGRDFWMRDGAFLDRTRDMPAEFYSTTAFTDEMVGYLAGRTPEERAKPFLAYLAYTAPHWPLQAPRGAIDRHRGVYDGGPEALRGRRLAALVARGLVPAGVEPAPMVGEATKEWADMDPGERAHSARRMETYAAMVELMDRGLGRVVDHLERSGELDNTFVVFMSDNGAEGKLLEALPVMAGVPLAKVIEEYYDNALENIGNADSFVWYGPRWACAATAPSRGFKAMTTEGGIRCPCIVRYPKLAGPSPRPPPSAEAGGEGGGDENGGKGGGGGSITREFTTVMDVLPTLLDLAGVPHPGTTFRGREVVAPRGRSWVPHLDGRAASVHGEGGDGGAAQDATMGWELFGRRAVRRGRWKAVFEPAPRGAEEWELYDLSADPGEVHNLAGNEPGVLEELLVEWERYFAETGMYDPGVEARRSKW